MIKPGLAFVSTSRQITFRTLVGVLLYGHVVHVSSCSLVLVSRHERIVTVGNFYTKDANARLN
jgi:non-ribosomal peptide synthetase component F